MPQRPPHTQETDPLGWYSHPRTSTGSQSRLKRAKGCHSTFKAWGCRRTRGTGSPRPRSPHPLAPRFRLLRPDRGAAASTITTTTAGAALATGAAIVARAGSDSAAGKASACGKCHNSHNPTFHDHLQVTCGKKLRPSPYNCNWIEFSSESKTGITAAFFPAPPPTVVRFLVFIAVWSSPWLVAGLGLQGCSLLYAPNGQCERDSDCVKLGCLAPSAGVTALSTSARFRRPRRASVKHIPIVSKRTAGPHRFEPEIFCVSLLNGECTQVTQRWRIGQKRRRYFRLGFLLPSALRFPLVTPF